jgi:hypothetical protein
MQRQVNVCLVVLGIALVGTGTGCGDSAASCEDFPSPAVLEVTLAPDSVSAGSEVTVVAAFERAVFENGEFFVADESVVLKDAATDRRIGEFSNSRFGEDQGDPPLVSGVVSSGVVIDDRSIELTLDFPNALPEGAVVEMRATSGIGDCSTLVSGEALLGVTAAQ